MDIQKITWTIAVVYAVVMFALIFILEIVLKKDYILILQGSTFLVYRNFIDRCKNIFEAIFYPLVSLYLILIYFIYNAGWVNIYVGIVVFLYFLRLVINIKKERGRFFNIPYRKILITNMGIVINDELLVYGIEKNKVIMVLKVVGTHRATYYSVNISNCYVSKEFIRPISQYQYQEFIKQLKSFFEGNGISVEIQEIEE